MSEDEDGYLVELKYIWDVGIKMVYYVYVMWWIGFMFIYVLDL